MKAGRILVNKLVENHFCDSWFKKNKKYLQTEIVLFLIRPHLNKLLTH